MPALRHEVVGTAEPLAGGAGAMTAELIRALVAANAIIWLTLLAILVAG